MSKTCIIEPISLVPYEENFVFIVCGYSAEDFKGYINDNTSFFGKVDTMFSIKKTFAKKKLFLDFIDRNADEIDSYDKGGKHRGNGVFIYNSNEETVERHWLIVLKYGFDPDNRDNLFTLAHEVLHLCQAFLPRYLNRDYECEAEAYFHNNIMRETCNAFDQSK